MSLVSALETIETDVLNYVKSEEGKIANWWKGFSVVAEADVVAAWQAYKPEVLGAIAAVEQIGVSLLLPGANVNFDKLAAAVSIVASVLAAKGVTVAKGVLVTVIQQAVNSLGIANKPQ